MTDVVSRVPRAGRRPFLIDTDTAGAIADFAVAYADQNERDHAAMVEAVREGRLDVYLED